MNFDSKNYNFKEIESKWQRYWEDNNVFAAKNDYSLPKYYPLVEFPYPSGQGLHVGHPRSYTALDIVARKRRLEGFNVLYAMGWDAFGLPAENFAIKNKIHPSIVTQKNIANFKAQLKSLGMSFDWSREIDTTSPEYFKWTQWIFLQLFKHGLAYKKEMNVNWCTSCKVVLANEEVVNGVCERCSGKVVRKVKSQWILKITDYAQKLLDGLEEVDYGKRIKVSQKNWIGRSQGAKVLFDTTLGDKIEVYTTRPDTLFGVTYMVLAPEHELIKKWASNIKNISDINTYCEKAAQKSDFERQELNKDKTGVKIEGVEGINPVNGEKIPLYISDYVLASYGTGAIMSVPAHDSRDWEFAKKYNIPIKEVVFGGNVEKEAFTGEGTIINSEFLNGLSIAEAKNKMIEWLKERKIGDAKVNFKLRDWIFSRQRYWGEPIPIINCEHCGYVPVPEDELPLELPKVENYQPTNDGESPLANISEWVNVKCPVCGADAKRETDTMPQWAGSSWYFLRYCDPHNSKELASKEALNYWLPVDWYNGGMEHVTRHMIYSRFWNQFLYDIGVVPVKEPYKKRTAQGLILGPDNEKMSKSKGNVVDPLTVIKEYGADTLRMYMCFIGDYEQATPWNDNGVKGVKRFLDRVYRFVEKLNDNKGYTKDLEVIIHKTIKEVSSDIEQTKFNTAISKLMILSNEYAKMDSISKDDLSVLIKLMNPFAPHISEEINEMLGNNESLVYSNWPIYDESKTIDTKIEIAVQVNGKLRGTILVEKNAPNEVLQQEALKLETVKMQVENKTIRKIVCVPNRIVNIVVG